jgi:hypothetical protein
MYNTITKGPDTTLGGSRRGSERSQLDAFLGGNPASVGVLAGVVTMAGQIAAQFEMPSHACRLTALTFALLLACYQVHFAQKRSTRESLFLVPIVAVTIFTTGWGANGLIYEAQANPPVARTAPAEPHVSSLERIGEFFIPSAHAAVETVAQTDRDRDRRRRRDGWKRW